jgi:hypothetical protein
MVTGILLLAVGCDPTGSAPDLNTGDSQTTVDTATQSRTKRAGATTTSDGDPRQRDALAAQRQDTEQARQTKQQEAEQAAQERLIQPKTFEDYQTGLTVTFQYPWYIVRTDWKGPIFGKDGKSYMDAAFTTITKDKGKSAEPGFIYTAADTIANGVISVLQTLTFQKESHKPKKSEPMDVMLTQKLFPNLNISFRYRGNDGRSIIQECRPKTREQTVYVYHVIAQDKIASFAMYNDDNKPLLD